MKHCLSSWLLWGGWIAKLSASRRIGAVKAARVCNYVLCYVTNLAIILQDSDGEKSDDLVVDVSNEVGRSTQS